MVSTAKCPWSRFFSSLPKWSESHSVVSDSLQPLRLYSPWNSPRQNIGMGSLSLLQGIFPTQGSNPGLPQLQVDSLPAEPQGKPSLYHEGILYSLFISVLFILKQLPLLWSCIFWGRRGSNTWTTVFPDSENMSLFGLYASCDLKSLSEAHFNVPLLPKR